MASNLKAQEQNPWNQKVEPTYTQSRGPGGSIETLAEHPAYAMIGASRVSGGTMLFGSDFQHNSFVRVTVRSAYVKRDLSNDWPHANKELIEIDMSESQWSEFVSAMNIGFGAQCTLRHVLCKPVPGIPYPEKRMDQFRAELAEDLSDSLASLAELEAAIGDLKLPAKQKDELLKRVGKSRSSLTSSIPFVARQFSEHVEATVAKAKLEINAHAIKTAQHTGVQSLGGAAPVITYDPEQLA